MSARHHPLRAPRAEDDEDSARAVCAAAGDRHALEVLIERHQVWVYALALRMVRDPDVAADLAQDALIRIVTRIAQFEQRSSFRTWAYRIVVNTILDARRSAYDRKRATFADLGATLDELGSEDLEPGSPVEHALLFEETRTNCMFGMLLCLDREQRMVYVLGDIFETPSEVAAEILEISAANFRKRLERARADLGHFMYEKCGLVDPANPCRCPKKTKGLIRAGVVDPAALRFVDREIEAIRRHASEVWERLQEEQTRTPEELFRSLHLGDGPDVARALQRLSILPIID